MAEKSWNPGDVLTASDMNTWAVPLAAVATGDQTTSSGSYVNDNALSLAVAANATYLADLFVRCYGPSGFPLLCQFTGPASSALSATYLDAAATNDITLGTNFGPGSLLGAGVDLSFAVTGTLTTGGTAGTLQFQFYGATQPVARRARSRLTLHRIG